MSRMRNIVLGEASESENEDEVAFDRAQSMQDSAVFVESPETDDEQAPTVFQIPSSDECATSTNVNEYEKKYDSLLHKKLCERNQSLRKNIVDLYKNTTTKAIKQLNSTDHNLLQSQIILQSASVYLQTVDETLHNLHGKLQGLLESNFIPDIYIPKAQDSGIEQ